MKKWITATIELHKLIYKTKKHIYLIMVKLKVMDLIQNKTYFYLKVKYKLFYKKV